MNRKIIGSNIRKLRKEKKMTQAMLAELVNVTNDHISHIEIGTATMSLQLFIDLCKALQATPNDILLGEYVSSEFNDILADNSNQKYASNSIGMQQDLTNEDTLLLQHLYEYLKSRKKESE